MLTPAVGTVGTRRSLLRSPVGPAGLVLVLYAVWLFLLLPVSHDARDFIHEGRKYIEHGHGSALIVVDSYVVQHGSVGGYDGQYCYYIALDPLHAASYLDVPAYRYTRILYPMLARLLALGQTQAIPFAMVGINLAAMVLGTLAVAAWLARKKRSVWYSLIYGLYPGLMLGVLLDLTEPLCYALVACGAYLFEYGGRNRLWWSAAAFSLAALSRETSLVFPLLYAAGLVCGWGAEGTRPTRLRAAGLFAAIAAGPFLVYKAFLAIALGSAGLRSDLVELRPFGGILASYPWQAAQVGVILCVFLPGIICGCAGLLALRGTLLKPDVWVLLANVLLFVVLLAPSSAQHYVDAGRISAGVVLAALYCIPASDGALLRSKAWLWLSAACWLVLPFVGSFWQVP